jgi:hypothetical protein
MTAIWLRNIPNLKISTSPFSSTDSEYVLYDKDEKSKNVNFQKGYYDCHVEGKSEDNSKIICPTIYISQSTSVFIRNCNFETTHVFSHLGLELNDNTIKCNIKASSELKIWSKNSKVSIKGEFNCVSAQLENNSTLETEGNINGYYYMMLDANCAIKHRGKISGFQKNDVGSFTLI